jgi:hypothetical protein
LGKRRAEHAIATFHLVPYWALRSETGPRLHPVAWHFRLSDIAATKSEDEKVNLSKTKAHKLFTEDINAGSRS